MKLYRLLAGDDSVELCYKVSDALSKDWEPYGITTSAHYATVRVMPCGQAVVKEVVGGYLACLKLGAL